MKPCNQHHRVPLANGESLHVHEDGSRVTIGFADLSVNLNGESDPAAFTPICVITPDGVLCLDNPRYGRATCHKLIYGGD